MPQTRPSRKDMDIVYTHTYIYIHTHIFRFSHQTQSSTKIKRRGGDAPDLQEVAGAPAQIDCVATTRSWGALGRFTRMACGDWWDIGERWGCFLLIEAYFWLLNGLFQKVVSIFQQFFFLRAQNGRGEVQPGVI